MLGFVYALSQGGVLAEMAEKKRKAQEEARKRKELERLRKEALERRQYTALKAKFEGEAA